MDAGPVRSKSGVCALLALFLALQGGLAQAWGPAAPIKADLVRALAAPGAREGIARVAWAEAANQGDSGLLAVVCTILNRLTDRRWGASVDAVLNARAQFEPVLRAGGDWRGLPALRPQQRARIDALINLILDGRLPDPTGGALYFQNPAIVAARAQAGQVSPRLVHFGGARPSVVIGDHAFYVETAAARAAAGPVAPPRDAIFVPRAPLSEPDSAKGETPPQAGARGIFVLSDGGTVETRR